MGRFPSGQREQTVNLPLLASVVRIHPCPPYLREWRNWQTRMIQVHVYVRTCRFKSCFPHAELLRNQELFFVCHHDCIDGIYAVLMIKNEGESGIMDQTDYQEDSS